jgi:hypothetical protein
MRTHLGSPGTVHAACTHECEAVEVQWKVTASVLSRRTKSIGIHIFSFVAGELQRMLRLSALMSCVYGACPAAYATCRVKSTNHNCARP